MIETLIVAAVLAALSLFAMEILDRQNRMIKTVENKFSLQSVHNQIIALLADRKNCFESLKDTNLKKVILSPDEETAPLPSLQKEYLFRETEESDIESEYRSVFYTILTDPASKYEGITIQKYGFALRADNLLEEDSLNATVSFDVTYDLGANTIGGRIQRKSINLSLKFDPDNPEALSSCNASSAESSAPKNLSFIDTTLESEFKDMTGDEACESIGKSCIQVISQNFASKAYGQIGIGNLCHVNYNIPLPGVKQGTPVSNIHDCTAKLGQFETYKVEQTAFGVTCQGIFKAQCQ